MNRAILLLGALLEAKRGEQYSLSAFRILVGIDGAPEKVKAEAKASWLRARQIVSVIPPAIRAAELMGGGNVVALKDWRRRRAIYGEIHQG